ncbi:hypothetical protein ACH5RR_005275 [Cinchona calisaya]|uniref:Copper transport protein n=1 Tax=Cinchona calisaya TaxID=153742 RepID=A0ABD3AKX5_9GENT
MNHGDMPMPSPPDSMYNNSTKMSEMVMQMSFFWGKNVVVLFKGWPDHSLGMYILALILVFFLGFGVEVLSATPSMLKRGTNPVASSLSHAGIYAIRMALVYLIMLSVMSFNLGIFIVAVAGHAVGYFVANFLKLANTTRIDETTSNSDPKV